MKTIMRKTISCLMAAVLAVGLVPMGAFGAESLDDEVVNGGVSRITSDGGEASTSVGIVVGAGFAVADPTESMFEEGYGRGEAISVWARGGKAPYTARWEYAVAAFDATGKPLYSSAVRMPVGNTAGDSQVSDEQTGAVEFRHIPNGNDSLAPGGTYWYWLTVTDANGNSAAQAVEAPYLVARQSAYRPGPFTDNAAQAGWTWAVAGAGAELAPIGAGSVANAATGAIHNGITLSSDALDAASGAFGVLSGAAQPMRVAGAWTVAITEVQPAGDDAYKGSVLVMIDASSVDMPSVAAGAVPVPGVDFELLRLSADGTGAQALSTVGASGLSYADGIISFIVKDSAASGLIGTFALAVKPKDGDAGKSFTVETAVRPAAAGTVGQGGIFAYQQQPTITFSAHAGYKVEGVELSLKPTADAPGAPRVVEVPKRGEEGASAPYGTWEGNSYTFPKEFNSTGDEGYALLTVVFTDDPDYVDPTPLELSVSVTGAGAAYVGAVQDATKVTGSSTFVSGATYGSFTLKANERVVLTFAPDAGARLESLTVNGELIRGVTDSYAIASFNKDMDVQVVFADGLPVPKPVYTVRADYDASRAQVGFGATGTQWVSEAEVAEGGSVALVVRPKLGYQLESARLFEGGDTAGADVTADCADGLLELADVRADIRVRFEFSAIELTAIVDQAPLGSSIATAAGAAAVGAHIVTIEAPLRLVIAADAGYQLREGSLKLGDIALSPSSVHEEADGTTSYQVDISYADLLKAGNGAHLSFDAIKKVDADQMWFTISATAGAHGKTIARTVVARGGTATVQLFPDEGYRVAYAEVDGSRITGAGAAVSNSISCDIRGAAPFVRFTDVAEDYRLHVAFERIPGPGEPDGGDNPGAEVPDDPVIIVPEQPDGEGGEGPGGSIVPGSTTDGRDEVPVHPGTDQVFTFIPEDDTWVLDRVVVDGIEVLDGAGVQLKDKLTQTNGAGLLFEPGMPISYEPATGEYVIENADGTQDRFVLDLDALTLTLLAVKAPHTVSGTFARIGAVTIDIVSGEGASTAGTVTPRGTFGWKKKLPLVIVAAPENGSVLDAVYVEVDGEVRDVTGEMVEATAEHIRQAEAAQKMAYQRTDHGYKPIRLAEAAAIMAVAEAGAAAPAGARAYVIPDGFLQPGKMYTVHASFKQMRTVSARVEGGHGRIVGAASSSDALSVQVKDGAACTVSYLADPGYRVKAVYDNGREAQGFTETGYRIASVDADHEIVVQFEPYSAGPAAGSSKPIDRVVRRLTSLAQTGDLNLPGIVALAGVASAAAGIAVISATRRRKRERSEG